MYLRNLRLLFVDDEPDFVVPIAAYLTHRYQHVTKHCISVEDAQKELARENYDIIFLDYHFAGMSGIDFLRWTVEKKVETPVIVVTAKGAEEVAVEAMKLGAYDYLNKGAVQLDSLPIVINNAYERFVLRKAQRELDVEKMNRERNELAISVFQETVKTFVQRMNNDLANIMVRMKFFEKTRERKKAPEDRDLTHLLGEVEFSTKAIEATVSSLVKLNQTVTKLHDVEKKAVDLKQELERTLKALDNRGEEPKVESA